MPWRSVFCSVFPRFLKKNKTDRSLRFPGVFKSFYQHCSEGGIVVDCAAIRTVLAGRDGVVRFVFWGPDCRTALLNSRFLDWPLGGPAIGRTPKTPE